MLKRIVSSTLAIILAAIVLTGFARPALARPAWTEAEFRLLSNYAKPAFIPNGELSYELLKGAWYGIGGALGGVAGTMIACYTVDALIAPVNPPAAAYLATLCPGIGATVGGAGGLVGANTVISLK